MKQKEAGASSGEGPSTEAPAASLATEFAPTLWQGRWGGAGKRPGRNSLWFPWPGAAEALRGLLKAMCPRPKHLDGDPDRTAGCHPCVCVGGGITPNKGGGGAQVSGSPYLPGCFSSLASPEPGARASVCKQTGHVAAATRSPPLAPREPSGRPLGTATAPPHPSRAACSAGAGPSPERTARTGAESAPRPREPSSRSPNT